MEVYTKKKKKEKPEQLLIYILIEADSIYAYVCTFINQQYISTLKRSWRTVACQKALRLG